MKKLIHVPDGLPKKRVILLVMDGVGAGELPDAHLYGDKGSSTLGNLASTVGGLDIPWLEKLGLGNIISIAGVASTENPRAAWGKMAMQSKGKDSTSGHWEMTGVILRKPFPVYPHGFPREIIAALEKKIGRKVLGNKVASGTVIIEELGKEHLKTGFPIVYTSADSVLQIAAHEEIISLPELYHICSIARSLMSGEHAVGRVIARPFRGVPNNFERTPRRKDFALFPPRPTLLDNLQQAGYEVISVGKVADLFAGRGITSKIPAAGNEDIASKALAAFQELNEGLIFATLVDFDMLYGHRNDAPGFARALGEFDQFLPKILEQLGPDDLLVLTADHGCDPTTPSTDHSREYVPLLMVGAGIKPVFTGVRSTMADLGATLAHFFGVDFEEGTPIKEILR